MADIVAPEVRSRMMAGIRSRDTKPEKTVRSYLHRRGLRFRLGGCGLPGHPDLVLPAARAVVLVHGCFWHRHNGCSKSAVPKTRTTFWQEKFARNVQRDVEVTNKLNAAGWLVEIIWECEASNGELLRKLTERLIRRKKQLADGA